MFENGKEVCVYESSANIKKKAEQAPTTTTAPAPVVPTPAPTPAPVTPTPAPTGTGWYRDGAPVITKSPYADTAAWYGKTLSISDGSATGSVSAKVTSPFVCSGTWTGTETWTSPPSFMQPGSKVTFTASSTTTGPSCGLGVGSWSSLKVDGAPIVQGADTKSPATGTYTVRTGKPGAKMTVHVGVQVANLTGNITYNYIYK